MVKKRKGFKIVYNSDTVFSNYYPNQSQPAINSPSLEAEWSLSIIYMKDSFAKRYFTCTT